MKNIILLISIVASLSNLSAQEYRLLSDLSKSSWTGYGEIGGFKQEGIINLKNGSLSMEDGSPSKGMLVFDAKSIEHENKELRKHLKAKDFFYVKKYPEITFEITSCEKDKVKGRLTVRGITREETFPYEMIQENAYIIFVGKAKIDRTKYDIKYNSSSYFQDLGNYAIKNEFDLEFRLVFESTKLTN